MPSDLSHVYVAADNQGRHKIGRTGNPQLRRYHLERDAGRPVTMIHVELTADADAIERFAHWELVDQHLGGEWFDATAEDAIRAIVGAKASVGAGRELPPRLAVIERYGLPARTAKAIDAALKDSEARSDFIRVAVEQELKRRERKAR